MRSTCDGLLLPHFASRPLRRWSFRPGSLEPSTTYTEGVLNSEPFACNQGTALPAIFNIPTCYSLTTAITVSACLLQRLKGVTRRANRKTGVNTGSEQSKVHSKLPEEFSNSDLSSAFQSSLGRLCTLSEATEVVSALQSWRSALLSGATLDKTLWPPEPLGMRVRAAINDLELSAFVMKCPKLIDTVLLNILELVERSSVDAKYSDDPDEADGGGLQLPFGFNFSSEDATPPSDTSEDSGEITGRPTADTARNAQASANDPKQFASIEDMSSQTQAVQGQGGHEPQKSQDQRAQAQVQDDVESRPDATEKELNSSSSSKSSFVSRRDGAPTAGGIAVQLGESDLRDSAVSTPSSWDHYHLYQELLVCLPELQDLIRKMGRRAGLKSRLRFDLAQREKSNAGEGIVRSPRMPSETSGITRSDGQCHVLLPGELSLIAYANSKRANSTGAKALHRLRRAEASLLSYERSGWMEEKARSLSWREFRPGSERGPLICCVDTSRSMAGKEEAIAKAAVLEILRLAEDEKRRCHLFFFSGSNQLQELEVPPAPIPAAAWQGVLDRAKEPVCK